MFIRLSKVDFGDLKVVCNRNEKTVIRLSMLNTQVRMHFVHVAVINLDDIYCPNEPCL